LNALFEFLGLDGPRLAKVLFEPNLLLLFALCFAHSVSAHGWKRTGREFSAGFLLTALAESAGVLSGAYVYPGFQFYVFATPVGNPASWVALVYVIMKVSERIVFGQAAILHDESNSKTPLLWRGGLIRTICLLAFLDASIALMLDLVLDPLATIYNWWLWVPCAADVSTVLDGTVNAYNFDHLVWMTTPDNPVAVFFRTHFFVGGFRYPTRLLGIPLINFVAWLVFVFVFSFQFRFVEAKSAWSEWKRTFVLWAVVLIDVPILALLLIAPNL
jgi:hypothetical protein